MNINYGIMQGRLLPAYKGFYQAHPIDNWEKRISLCKDNKINAIEFIFMSIFMQVTQFLMDWIQS